MTIVTLTDSQQKSLMSLKKFAKSKHKHFRLTGYAGTGKSFLIAQFLKWLQEQDINFIAASPTNKAAKNLEAIGTDNGFSFEVTTIAKLLGQQPELNEATGKEEFVTGDSTIGDYDLVILDEFSMISKSNFEDIVCEIYGKDTKIVYVGDPAQLPPVGEKFPIIATHIYITQSANLSEVVRYDGDIARIAETIRNESLFNKVLYPFVTTSDETITCLDREAWLDYAIRLFKSSEYQANPNYARILVWRNKTASVLNDSVRYSLWGKDAPDYVIGDRLIAKSPVFRPNPNASDHKGKNQWQIIINSSEEVEVIGEAKQGIDKAFHWNYWEVPVKTDDGLTTMLRLLTGHGEKERQEVLKNFHSLRRWQQYHYYSKLYDNVPYAYAITTHKAQGSSIDYAFIDTVDMRGCPDLQKILYTALTRAKVQAFIPTISN